MALDPVPLLPVGSGAELGPRLRRLALCDATADLEFERGSDGATRWRMLDATGRIDVVEAAPCAPGGRG